MDNYNLTGNLTLTYGAPEIFAAEANISINGADVVGIIHLVEEAQYIPIRGTLSGTTFSSTGRTMVFRKEIFVPALTDDLVLVCDIIGTVSVTGIHLIITGPGINLDATLTYTEQTTGTGAITDPVAAIDMTPKTLSQTLPTRVNMKHDIFLNTAALMGVTVLPTDTNQEIKEKILRAAARQRNSGYEGLVNAISQDLNLDQQGVIRLGLKSGSTPTASERGIIEIDGGFLRIFQVYFDAENVVLDLEVSIRDGKIASILDLCTYISQNSTRYDAVALSKPFAQPKILMHQKNIKRKTEILEATTQIKLAQVAIIPGTVKFSNPKTFKKEVESNDYVLDIGDYYIDYDNGVIFCASAPVIGETIWYKYIEWPYDMVGCDAVVNDFNGRPMRRHLFTQNSVVNPPKDVTLQTSDGLPTIEASNFVQGLLDIAGDTVWGK